MEKIKSTLYLTEAADCWLLEQARLCGLSKTSVVQSLINAAMDATELSAGTRRGLGGLFAEGLPARR